MKKENLQESAKIGIRRNIINLIPKCSIFIETMAENGSIFNKIKLPETTIVNHTNQLSTNKQNYDKNQNIINENLPYYKLFHKYAPLLKKKNAFAFFNPPQLSEITPTTPTKQNPWQKKEHSQFLTLVKTLKCKCMICQNPNPLYDKALKKWNTFNIENYAQNKILRLYINYPKPLILQDHNHLGSDYKDCQRIKRKANNFLNKLASFSEPEKTAVLSEIFLKYNQTHHPL